MKLRLLLAVPGAIVAAGLVLSACAGPSQIAGTASVNAVAAVESSTATSTPAAATPAEAAAAAAPVVDVAAAGELGEILVAANGLTLYGFTDDADGVSTCFDACATAWPALTVSEGFTAAAGLDPALFTTVDRPDGTKQLKAGTWPLYYYAGDGAPGETNGQGVGDVWFTVTTDGKLTKPGAAEPSAEVPAVPAAPAAPAAPESTTEPAPAPAPEPAPSDGYGAAATESAPAAAAGPVVQLAEVGNLGQVMVGANGHTLYAFTNDPEKQSSCFDACATAWPPLLVEPGFEISDELVAAGVTTFERPDGTTQLVMGKWALYYYSGDAAPGEANGQGSGDKWFAVDANCKLVKTAV